jgi:hypothetical protein
MDEKALPMVDDERTPASCDPRVYVSQEEVALLKAMRAIRSEGVELRSRIARCQSEETRLDLERSLGELRQRWRSLARRREQAQLRKMVMLGHLPPDEVELL